MSSGINESVDPCVDFYSFTCGKWLNDNPLPPGYHRLGTYDESQRIVDKAIATSLDMILNSSSTGTNYTLTELVAAKVFAACLSSEMVTDKQTDVNSILLDL